MSKHDLRISDLDFGSDKGQGHVDSHPCYSWKHNISGKQMSHRIIKMDYGILCLSCHNIVLFYFSSAQKERMENR